MTKRVLEPRSPSIPGHWSLKSVIKKSPGAPQKQQLGTASQGSRETVVVNKKLQRFSATTSSSVSGFSESGEPRHWPGQAEFC